MKFNSLVLSAACASMLFAGSAMAQQPAKQPSQVIDASGKVAAVTAIATIAAIDPKNRVVTLKGPQGNEFAVDVGAKVNLGGLTIGDTVDATYVRAVALDFQKGDGIRMDAQTVTVDGNAAMKRTTVVTNIWALDSAQGTVTVLGPYGHLSEVQLKDPAQLSGVKVGDQMKITYTRAFATALVKKA
jgi:Cu/Ag efflux protein CusF